MENKYKKNLKLWNLQKCKKVKNYEIYKNVKKYNLTIL